MNEKLLNRLEELLNRLEDVLGDIVDAPGTYTEKKEVIEQFLAGKRGESDLSEFVSWFVDQA